MIRRFCWLLGLIALAGSVASAQDVTLTGTLVAANGLTASNYTVALQPSQIFFVANTSVVINTTVFCATSTDGTVVGTGNPSSPLVGSVAYTGTLTPATYFIEYAWYDASGNVTLPSPEQTLQLTSTGQLQLSPPTSGMPATAAGVKIYIGTSSGTETLQGATTGGATYTQSTPLTSGTTLPTTNTTICKVVANDAGWPTGTGYNVTLTDPSGNTLPGYPMMWRLLGPNTTINLSNGLPTYNGLVTYPVPILATPLNHNPQSISGPLSLTNYSLTNVLAIGVGTGLPAWPIDVENGPINASGGYLVNGAAGTTGQCLGVGASGRYDTPVDCITSVTTYYQTMAANGTAQTQRQTLNFAPRLALTDSGSPSETTVDLATSGVAAGSYVNPTCTFDIYGRATTCAAGPTPRTIQTLKITSGICTAAGGSYNTCTMSAVNWPTPFINTSYSLQCFGFSPSNGSGPTGSISGDIYSAVPSTTGITLSLQTMTSSGFSYGEIDCTGIL